jgi:hypothetical protein
LSVVAQAVDEIPKTWIDDDYEEITRLLAQLASRQRRVRELVDGAVTHQRCGSASRGSLTNDPT